MFDRWPYAVAIYSAQLDMVYLAVQGRILPRCHTSQNRILLDRLRPQMEIRHVNASSR